MGIKTMVTSYDEFKKRIEAVDKMDEYFQSLDLAVAWDLSYRHIQAFLQYFREIYELDARKSSRSYFYNRDMFRAAYIDHVNLPEPE